MCVMKKGIQLNAVKNIIPQDKSHIDAPANFNFFKPSFPLSLRIKP